MLSPIITLFKHFPLRAYTTVLIMLFISWYAYKRIRCYVDNGNVSARRGVLLWVLINDIILLLFFTVLGRRSLDYYRYNFEAGYSYRDVFLAGDPSLAFQIAVNIAAFVPVGALGSLTAKRRGFLKGLLLGAGLSLCIESLQLALRCGTAEIDDLISNSLGTLFGCLIAGICCLLRRFYPRTGVHP